eukprot:COSAG05_NODE_2208_length_3395_cov_3.434466_3_plen_86_part_00
MQGGGEAAWEFRRTKHRTIIKHVFSLAQDNLNTHRARELLLRWENYRNAVSTKSRSSVVHVLCQQYKLPIDSIHTHRTIYGCVRI